MSIEVPHDLPGGGRTLRSVFIVGAPRCGTTFLSKTLGRHPQVCFSKPKETHFFTLGWDTAAPEERRREFVRRYFRHLTTDHLAIAEGSPSHLYEPEIAARIGEIDPEARIVVAVRNPIEMLESVHARLVYLLDEDVADFSRAWGLQEARARGEQIPKRCRDPRMLQYEEVGRIAPLVERLFEAFGRERCHVVVYDDLASDPAKTYRGLLEFIGVEDDGRTRFERTRENRAFGSPWLQQFVVNPPWPISLLAVSWQLRGWKRPRALKAVRRWLKKRNTRTAVRETLQPEMRETLRRTFAPDVQHLEHLVGRDLSHWR